MIFVFLLRAPTEVFTISDESNLLKWVTLQELSGMAERKEISPSMERMMKKWVKLMPQKNLFSFTHKT